MDESRTAAKTPLHALYMRSSSGWILEVIDTPEYCAVTEPTAEKAIAVAREQAAAILDVPVEQVELLVASGLYDEDDGTWEHHDDQSLTKVTPQCLRR